MNTAYRSGYETGPGSDRDDVHPYAYCQVRVYRTWFFWSFVLLPIAVILGWTQYISLNPPSWLGIDEMRNAGHWAESMRYYIWLQLVWLPANMMIFLVWCALGVRIWNCKRKLPTP